MADLRRQVAEVAIVIVCLALSRGQAGRAGDDPRPWSGTRRRSAPTTPARSAAPTTSADHRHRVLGAIALFLEEADEILDQIAAKADDARCRRQGLVRLALSSSSCLALLQFASAELRADRDLVN